MVKQTFDFIRRYLFWIVIFIISMGLVAQVIAGRIDLFSTSYYSPLYSVAPYSLEGNATITQKFQAKYPGLNRLELFVRKSGDDADARLVFHLKNACESEADVVTTAVNFSDLPGNGLYAFEFQTIDNSLGREYCAVINTQALDAPAEVYIYASISDVYWSGSAAYQPDTLPRPRQTTENKNSQAKYFVWLPLVQRSDVKTERPTHNFDVGFKLYYNGPTEPTLEALTTYLAANKPLPFGWPVFYIFMGILYAVGLIIFWRIVVSLKSGPKL
jgi:hypothetical protein